MRKKKVFLLRLLNATSLRRAKVIKVFFDLRFEKEKKSFKFHIQHPQTHFQK